ncbi:hypothetical protein U1Q18_008756 [Sarracenia purpurea var. burkii]
MDFPGKLSQYKHQIAIAIVSSLIFTLFLLVAPQFITILSYFWPLFLSTTVFLVAMVLFSQISAPLDESYGEEAAEGLLDYVAEHPEQLEDY